MLVGAMGNEHSAEVKADALTNPAINLAEESHQAIASQSSSSHVHRSAGALRFDEDLSASGVSQPVARLAMMGSKSRSLRRK